MGNMAWACLPELGLLLIFVTWLAALNYTAIYIADCIAMDSSGKKCAINMWE